KAATDRMARPGTAVRAGAAIAAPTPILGWDGQFDPNVTPPDPAGAVGTDRYVELVNQRYGIYDKMGTLKSSGDLGTLTGHTLGCLADPSVLWDTWQSRFYFSVGDFCLNTTAWGYSKTATPDSNADFCTYTANFGYGADIPDFPRMGNTEDFLLIGLNHFTNGGTTYVGSDLAWINKAWATAACPSSPPNSTGTLTNLADCAAGLAFTPVPAIQTDPFPNGWVVATEDTSSGQWQ